MLYLVEIKKQSKLFMGGLRNELKLLACQHNDQSWSSLPTEEIIVWEDNQLQVGEGALLLVNLGNNRQVQGNPELAGAELVRQLQKISRLMEKSKEDQEKIEQWKQSLTYQSQELSRREMDIEARIEQVEQLEQEFEYLERQRQELEETRERLAQEQQLLEKTKSQLGVPVDFNPELAAQIKALINRLASRGNQGDSPWQQINLILETIRGQEAELSQLCQQLEQKHQLFEQLQREVNQQKEDILRHSQELQASQKSLEQARIERQVQESILAAKNELLGQIDLQIQTQENLLAILTGAGDDGVRENLINPQELENMPLGELEAIVDNLKADLDKLVRFVNDQEEELSLQSQTVEELKSRLEKAADFERLSIEEELRDEQERKKMLDKTLGGQRRTLWERQDVFFQHLRVLRRRQGILELESQGDNIKIQNLSKQLEEEIEIIQQKQQNLQMEIQQIQNNLHQLEEMIQQHSKQQEQQGEELARKKEKLEQNQKELYIIEFQINLYSTMLNPLKNKISHINRQLEEFGQLFNPN